MWRGTAWQIRKRERCAQTVVRECKMKSVLKVGSQAFNEPKFDRACQQLSEEENTIRYG